LAGLLFGSAKAKSLDPRVRGDDGLEGMFEFVVVLLRKMTKHEERGARSEE